MKILELKLHESCKIGKSQEYHYYAYNVGKRTVVEFELDKELGGVYISGAGDKVFIPMVNIAYLKLEDARREKKVKEAEKSAKATRSTSPAKKPR